MNEQKSFLVTLQVGNATSSHVWDSRSAMPIGHPFRWVLERSESGSVQIRNIGGAPELEAGLIPAQNSSQATARLTAAAVEKGAEIELPENTRIARARFTLHIKPVLKLAPAYETHDGGRSELRVYECFGDWTQTAQAVHSTFIGRVEGKAVFKLEKILESRYVIISMNEGLKLGTPQRAGAELAPGERQEATAEELHDRVIRLGDYTWRLEGAMPGEIVPAIDLAQPDLSSQNFKRALKYACAALLVFSLTAGLWPHSKDDSLTGAVTTRLVLKKPAHQFMTSATRGDLKARDVSLGTTKTSKPRGATKVAHPTHLSTAKAVSHKAPGAIAKKKAVTKAAPKVAVKAVKTVKATVTKSKPVRHKPVVMTRVARVVPHRASFDPSKTKMARAFQGVAFKSASRSAVNGGMSRLLKQSRFGEGSDSRYEAQGMLNSRSALRGSGGYSSGTVGTRSLEVATLGGGDGGGGGGGGGGNYGGNGGVGYGRGSHALVSGQGKSFISVDMGASEVDEGLTKAQVAAVFQKHKSEMRYCHEATLLTSPGAQGSLGLKFTIGAAGNVKRLSVSESTGFSALDECVTRRLVTWKFPQPKGGVDVAVSHPQTFKTLR